MIVGGTSFFFFFFFAQRTKEYLVGSSLVCKLQAKHDQLKAAVENGIASAFSGKQLLTHMPVNSAQYLKTSFPADGGGEIGFGPSVSVLSDCNLKRLFLFFCYAP